MKELLLDTGDLTVTTLSIVMELKTLDKLAKLNKEITHKTTVPRNPCSKKDISRSESGSSPLKIR